MAYQLRELQANYAGRQIYDIDKIIIPEGKVIGLIGVNGAGKTTLIKELKNREKQIRPKAVVELLPQLKPDEDISGGQQVQEYINNAFRRPSNILLLDEPTANLDLNHLNKLKYQLKYYPGTVIIISHDRDFLDGVVDEIWELQDGELQTFTGNYTEFVDYKTNQRDQQAKDYQTYRNKQKQLQRALNKKKTAS
ncbi:ATP-binding cassette domain-containing protein [Lentilactobacillus laojiaonis]|uniref:ATP-binding cassette domain-containing protein n=1 Tax=Lentilactobacillus laojiaonis TaxID=2883998 RepID=UPI001D0B3B25|nr:ABC transporter ATP-binding protein [Lentilactobacillus laojiaonis]UDM32708.1 ABC transporter ATP-binding protein [Lentilactobacillus laojiaonis]